MKPDIDEVQRIARDVAAGYARRGSYGIDKADLFQEAVLAVLRAAKTFDPGRGVRFAAYAGNAAMYAVRSYLWQNGTPVNSSHGERHRLEEVRRLPLSATGFLRAPAAPADARLHDERWKGRVRAWVRGNDRSGLGREAVMSDRWPREVAEEARVPARRVQRAVEKLRARARKDGELKRLWEER
jgi:hypothetical protein